MPPCPAPPGFPQRGAIVMPMIVTVLVLGASTLALQAAKQTRRPLAELRTTEQRLDRIEQALRAYALIRQELPCAADGALDTGLANPTLGACITPEGTVPWATLGLQKDDALDAWNRKISYRVREGNTSLIPPPATLTVRDDYVNPPTIANVAWVLISHGPTGYGAWLLKGNSPAPAQRMVLPTDVAAPSFDPDEYSNTQLSPATGFVKKPFNVVDLSPSQVAFFDDVVSYKTLTKLLEETGLGENDQDELEDDADPISLDSTNLDPTNTIFSGFSSGKQTLTIPGSDTAPALTVSVQAGQQIVRDNTGSPKTGIGVCNASGPCNSTNAQLSGAETLSFKLVDKTAYKLGVLFKNFTLAESAQITFMLNGAQVGTVVSYSASGGANATNLVPTVASATFDEVVIGAGAVSSFFIDKVRFCNARTHCDPVD